MWSAEFLAAISQRRSMLLAELPRFRARFHPYHGKSMLHLKRAQFFLLNMFCLLVLLLRRHRQGPCQVIMAGFLPFRCCCMSIRSAGFHWSFVLLSVLYTLSYTMSLRASGDINSTPSTVMSHCRLMGGLLILILLYSWQESWCWCSWSLSLSPRSLLSLLPIFRDRACALYGGRNWSLGLFFATSCSRKTCCPFQPWQQSLTTFSFF